MAKNHLIDWEEIGDIHTGWRGLLRQISVMHECGCHLESLYGWACFFSYLELSKGIPRRELSLHFLVWEIR